MPTLIHESWFNKYGTGVTNFTKKQLPIYKKAIEVYRDLDFIISDKPTGINFGEGVCSLHYVGSKTNLSEFWRVFDRIEKQQLEKEKTANAKAVVIETGSIMLKLTRDEAEALCLVGGKIGGRPEGIRGQIDRVCQALRDAGICKPEKLYPTQPNHNSIYFTD